MLHKLINKYHSLNMQFKVVIWFTFAGILQKGISIVTTPIFTRMLTTSEYGLFNVFSAWYNVFAVIATLYLHNGVINNAFVKRKESRETIISSFQSLSLVIAAGFLLLSVIFSNQLANLIKLPSTIIIFMFICLLFTEPYQDWLIYERYRYNYKRPVAFTLTISILTPLVSVLCILLTNSNHGNIRVFTFGVINIIVPGIIFYIYNYIKSPVFYNKELWKYAAAFNLPLIPHYLSQTILNQTDKIMINGMVGTSEAGIYSVAYSAAALILTFSTALNTAFVPWQYQKLKVCDYRALRKMANVVLTFLASILSLLLLFAPEVVGILSGSAYSGAVYLIPTLGASVFFNYMYQLFSRVEMYYEKRAYTVIATVIATISNIILNLLWIPKWGYQAAGVSTLIAHIIFCVLHYVFYKKVCKENIQSISIYNGKMILLISASVLVTAALTTYLYRFFVARLIVALIVLVIIILKRNDFIKTLKKLMFTSN